MVDIIQIYRSKEIFEKSVYTPENRKQFETLNESVESMTGYVSNKILYLPNEYQINPDLKTANLIILQDIDGFNPFLINKHLESLNLPDWFRKSRLDFLDSNNKLIYGLRQLNSPKSFEIFKIGKSETDWYELFIDYVSNSMTIGVPERENHKICELIKNRPVRYRINGKSDFTMTGRKQRSFYEFDYLIEFIGQVDKVEYLPFSRIKQTKKLPIENYKLIDERKILK